MTAPADLGELELAELEQLAQELVLRVRDDAPAAVNRWLSTAVPNSVELYRLVFVLACAVPDDRSWKALTAWTLFDRPVPEPKPEPKATRGPGRKVAPCGTWGAYQRHRSRREDACDDCKRAARDYYRDLRDRKRAAA